MVVQQRCMLRVSTENYASICTKVLYRHRILHRIRKHHIHDTEITSLLDTDKAFTKVRGSKSISSSLHRYSIRTLGISSSSSESNSSLRVYQMTSHDSLHTAVVIQYTLVANLVTKFCCEQDGKKETWLPSTQGNPRLSMRTRKIMALLLDPAASDFSSDTDSENDEIREYFREKKDETDNDEDSSPARSLPADVEEMLVNILPY
ncbi:hypothetical protein J6590_096191 [Homalodisca vitripennis]|nr:hypothetical protein J6590_096191 [Homalodisca vitripennis]